MARIGPFPITTPPAYPGVYEIEGWRIRPGPTYARFEPSTGRWQCGGAPGPELAARRGRTSWPLNDPENRGLYHWYGVDEATSKGQA
jgi:hypothetical protein